jgi:hypothetical protein
VALLMAAFEDADLEESLEEMLGDCRYLIVVK